MKRLLVENHKLMESVTTSFSKAVIKVFLFLIIVTSSAMAQFGQDSHVSAQLISETTSIQAGRPIWLAVKLRMEPHWHIYWRNPGDTGLETTIDWQLPQGFSSGEIQWPYPERIVEDPLVIYGYHGEIYLLNEINVPADLAATGDITLKANVSWLECAEVCIPGDTEVSITLPVTEGMPATDERWIQVFSDARSQIPISGNEWKVSATQQDNNLLVTARAPQWLKDGLSNVQFFPYQTGIINYAAKQTFKKMAGSFELIIPLTEEDAQIPDTLHGILVSDNGWRGPNSEKAMEINVVMGQQLDNAGGSDALSSIWLAIIFSFLGGIILNLMPCVLPVLSIKIMGFINQAHDEDAQPWKHGLVFTMGVLVSFWVLAGALLILKAGGAQLGWGFQLQSPLFLIVLSSFMFLFGLSMFGVFEIGTSLTTVGGQQKSGWMGAFVSGVTATIVATPCTAPFMGSALGFALTQPAWVSLTVFTFIGLGMAAPFVLLSSVPAMLRFVPKPGRWMESMKQFMGFLLVATVVWLLWVLGIQAGSNAVTLVLLNLLITSIAAWVYGRWGHLAMPAKTRAIAIGLALIITIGSNGYVLAVIDDYAVAPSQLTGSSEGISWESYSDEKLKAYQQENRPVFIDFTAAWCLSCQVNEQVAFSSEEVYKKFKELNIAPLKADWTSRDENITRALAKFGRNSVPLYVYYSGERNSDPLILPEIITPGIILEALESTK